MTTKVLKTVNVQDKNCLISTNPEDCHNHYQMCGLTFYDKEGIAWIDMLRNVPCSPEGLTAEDAYHYLVFYGLAHEESSFETFAETFEMTTPVLRRGYVYCVKIKAWVKKKVPAQVWAMDHEFILSEREKYPNSPLYQSPHPDRHRPQNPFVAAAA